MAKRKANAGKATTPERVALDESFPEIELTTGKTVTLDGDLVFLIDTLYREFAHKHGFAPSFVDVQRELELIIEHMPQAQRREYFTQSLFLNYVTYENEMAERLADGLTKKATKTPRSKAK